MTHHDKARELVELLRKEPERFFSKVIRQKDGGCWLWGGNISGRGYGRVAINGKSIAAHRASLLIHGGNIPDGYVVDHMCMNRICVNPNHLRSVDVRTNSVENSSGPTAKNASRTHCPKGHEYTTENTRICSRGRRTCKTCQREWSYKFKMKRKALSSTGENG